MNTIMNQQPTILNVDKTSNQQSDILERFIFENNKHRVDILWENEKPLFKAADIGKILQIHNIHGSVSNFNMNEKVLRRAMTAGGKQKITFLTRSGCIRLIQRTRKEMPTAMLKYFNIEEHRFTPAETDFAQNIKLAFKDLEIHRNYRIGNFYVDLFIPKYNIVIEFDEPYHMQQQEKDENRKKIVMNLIREITQKEYGIMLRFKGNCNIFEAIYEIREQINSYIDLMQKRKETS